MCEEKLVRESTLDALKFLSQTHRKLHEQRRRAEIQAFFTTLFLFAIIGAASLHKDVQLPTGHTMIFLASLWVFMFLVSLFSILYLIGLHNANQVNKEFAESAEERIRDKLLQVNVEIPKPLGAQKPQAMTRWWQPIIITLFAIGAGVAMTLSLL